MRRKSKHRVVLWGKVMRCRSLKLKSRGIRFRMLEILLWRSNRWEAATCNRALDFGNEFRTRRVFRFKMR